MTTLKRYLISSFDTFMAAFGVAILPFLASVDNIVDWPTLQSTLWAAGVAGLVAGFRAVLKAFREWAMRPKPEDGMNGLIENCIISGDRVIKKNPKKQFTAEFKLTDIATVKESSNPKPMKKKGGKKC